MCMEASMRTVRVTGDQICCGYIRCCELLGAVPLLLFPTISDARKKVTSSQPHGAGYMHSLQSSTRACSMAHDRT